MIAKCQLKCTLTAMADVMTDPAALGRELADARAARGESFKTVANNAGVSAAYLQKLERGQVESPSPRILRQLAVHLEISYERLMELAGYETPRPVKPNRTPLGRALKSARLSESEERSVAAFVELLVGQRETVLRRRT